MRHGEVGPFSHLPPAPGWVYDHETLQWGDERGDVFDASDWVRYNQVHNDYLNRPALADATALVSTTWFPIESAPFDVLIEVCGRSFHDTSALFATVAKKAATWHEVHHWSTSDGHPFDGLGWEPLFWRVATEFPLKVFHLHKHDTNEGQL